MDTTTNIAPETTDASVETQNKVQQHPDTLAGRRRMVTIGAIFTLIGWLTMMINPWVSLGSTVAGLILSIIGVRIPQSPRRNIAITSIIASAVLLVVFALFASLLTII